MSAAPGVSVVVPVRNGERWLGAVIAAVLAQGDGRPLELIVVDDGSTDASREVARRSADPRVRLLDGRGRGAAAAINHGIRQARYPLICQVDQDVVPEPGWMARLTEAVALDGVAAAQGMYVTAAGAGVWARVAGLDLAQRYRRLRGSTVDHVCTGNSAYRADALRRVGLFDETLGYGYDNDMSYRLAAAGYRLAFCPAARSVHHWRESGRGYVAQQYGVGYGRLDVVAKHPRRVTGDDVSGAGMIAHAVLMSFVLGAFATAALALLAGMPWRAPAIAGTLALAALAVERLVAGIAAAVAFREPAGLGFAPVHLVRDAAWSAAVLVWTARRIRGRSPHPSHSMRVPS